MSRDWKIADAIKEAYPDINWNKFEDMDRATNAELWHGPLPSDYWTYADPLEHYVWQGYEKAVEDIIEILDPLPNEMFYDRDGNYVTSQNPDDDDSNWEYHCELCEEYIRKEGDTWESIDDLNSNCKHSPDYMKESIWVGGEWECINVRKELMFDETYKHIF